MNLVIAYGEKLPLVGEAGFFITIQNSAYWMYTFVVFGKYEITKECFFPPRVDTVSVGSKFFWNEGIYVITDWMKGHSVKTLLSFLFRCLAISSSLPTRTWRRQRSSSTPQRAEGGWCALFCWLFSAHSAFLRGQGHRLSGSWSHCVESEELGSFLFWH